MKFKTVCFDLDNTICTTISNNYKKSKPKRRVISFINKLYDEGYFIKIFTSRYMGRGKDIISSAKRMDSGNTKKQLKSWGLKYHKLILGKPSYDILIDDKSLFFKKNWINKLNNILKKNL